MKTITIDYDVLSEHIGYQEKYYAAMKRAMTRFGTVLPDDAADELEHLRQNAYRTTENIRMLLLENSGKGRKGSERHHPANSETHESEAYIYGKNQWFKIGRYVNLLGYLFGSSEIQEEFNQALQENKEKSFVDECMIKTCTDPRCKDEEWSFVTTPLKKLHKSITENWKEAIGESDLLKYKAGYLYQDQVIQNSSSPGFDEEQRKKYERIDELTL